MMKVDYVLIRNLQALPKKKKKICVKTAVYRKRKWTALFGCINEVGSAGSQIIIFKDVRITEFLRNSRILMNLSPKAWTNNRLWNGLSVFSIFLPRDQQFF
jgi:hypothetical protein